MQSFSVFHIEADKLHVVHLGVSQYFAGAVLWLLVYKILDGAAATNLNRVWDKIAEFYAKHQTLCQLSNLSLSMFHDAKTSEATMAYPRLKAKGAETKHLIPALRFAWMSLVVDQNCTPFFDHVRNCLDAQTRIEEVIDENRFSVFLNDQDVQVLQAGVDKYLAEYSRAVYLADTLHLCLFAVVPKHHYYYHWARRAYYINPRKGNASVDEHYLGILKEVAQASTAATALHKIPQILMEKYSQASALEG